MNNPTDFERDDLGRAVLETRYLDDVRARLSGWHFAQESMHSQAVGVLYYAEPLLKELDRHHGGYAR